MKFTAQPLAHGPIYDRAEQAYPSSLFGHRRDRSSFENPRTHSFGVVLNGEAKLVTLGDARFPIYKGMYFSVPGNFSLEGEADIAIFQRHGYRGLFSLGGPTEEMGRLCYIDNCTTTLLCPPPRDGDPSMSLLVFPAGTKQTPHIHPSIRLGAVLSGSGECVLGSGERQALKLGMVFAIETGLTHCFESGAQGMSVIAFHPDSEGGPTDKFHPMLNRTYLK